MMLSCGQSRSAAGNAALVGGKHRQRRTSWALFVVVVCVGGFDREVLRGWSSGWLDKGLGSEQARRPLSGHDAEFAGTRRVGRFFRKKEMHNFI